MLDGRGREDRGVGLAVVGTKDLTGLRVDKVTRDVRVQETRVSGVLAKEVQGGVVVVVEAWVVTVRG